MVPLTGAYAAGLAALAADYLTKPLIDDELLMTIERAFAQREVIEENVLLRKELDKKSGLGNVVGQDPRMLKVFDMVSDDWKVEEFSDGKLSLEEVEEQIHQAERSLCEVEDSFSRSEVYTNRESMSAVQARYDGLRAEIDRLMEVWQTKMEQREP